MVNNPKKTSKKVKVISSKNELIIQHNKLVESRYRLSLQEKRIVLWIISQIRPDDDDFTKHRISIRDFQKITDVSGNNMHKEIAKITMNLIQRGLSIRNLKNDTLLQVSWLNSAYYHYKEGFVELKIAQELKPYLLQLKEQFTQISLGDVMGLKSVHAIRIYELLKQYEAIGNREIPLTDLREFCGIKADQYKKFSHIKERIIDVAQHEISNKTDLLIDYEEIKTSRKITSINFKIKHNPNYGITEFEKFQNEKTKIIHKELRSKNILIERIMEYGFSRQTARKFLETDEEQTIENALKSVDLYRIKNDVKNTKALVRDAIKEKWNHEKFVKKDKFT